MALDGMGMMLKSFGIDPDKIKADIEAFQKGVKELLTNIDTKQSATLKAVTVVVEGQERALTNHDELMRGIEAIKNRQEEMWTQIQRALTMSSQVRLVPPSQNPPPPQQEQPQNGQSQP
jgi:hypothetical protein